MKLLQGGSLGKVVVLGGDLVCDDCVQFILFSLALSKVSKRKS